MRILIQTENREIERRYLSAAGMRRERQICVLHSEAQALERLFRDPFDALIADAPDGRIGMLSAYAPLCPKNLFLLLPAPTACAPLPAAVVNWNFSVQSEVTPSAHMARTYTSYCVSSSRLVRVAVVVFSTTITAPVLVLISTP